MRYCKQCKMNVQDQYLYDGDRCPLCGSTLPKPVEFKFSARAKNNAKLHDIMVEYIDINTQQHSSVVYTDVNNEMYNRIKFMSTNVVRVHDLTRKEN